VFEKSPDEQIRQLTEGITRDYVDVEPAAIERRARAVYEQIAAKSRAPAFIAVLTERRVRADLGAPRRHAA
jgi:hypothetical protein